MKKLNYYQVHKNKYSKLIKKSKLYSKLFYLNMEKNYLEINRYAKHLRKEAFELSKEHVDTKPIKYLLK